MINRELIHICYRCSTQVPVNSSFCIFCGSDLSSQDWNNYQSDAKPAHIKSFTATVNNILFNMIAIKGGSFFMGCDNEYATKPKHKARVNDFYLSSTLVTSELFMEFVKSTNYYVSYQKESFIWFFENVEKRVDLDWRHNTSGSLRSTEEFSHPVIYINWYDAVAFCHWLKLLTGKNYRLPTETEWEFAAGGGNMVQNDILSDSNLNIEHAWIKQNSGRNTHPVASRKPNSLGLYDMEGNVSEWCSDWFGFYGSSLLFYPNKRKPVPSRVIRGTYWYSDIKDNYVVARESLPPHLCNNLTGFRLAI